MHLKGKGIGGAEHVKSKLEMLDATYADEIV